ncbi:MAG: hypothetical protein WC227_02465 [Patescibacteria group bacterium]|jgi:hypothetical protein
MDLSNILGKGSGKPSRADSNGQFKIMSDSGSNPSIIILWVGVAISVLASGFLMYQNFSMKSRVADKKVERDTTVAKLDSSNYRQIRAEATEIQAKIAQIEAALDRRYPMADFMPQIFQRINSNVTVTSISLTNEGKFAMTGKTDSYRGAADQVMTFEAWKSKDIAVMNNIELGSIAISAANNNTGSVPVTITAAIPTIPSTVEGAQ